MSRRLLGLFIFSILAFIIAFTYLFFLSPKALFSPQHEVASPLGKLTDRVGSIFLESTDQSQDTTFEVTPADKQILTKIWPEPTAGHYIRLQQILVSVATTTASGTEATLQTKATTTVVLFVDRATGYVHEYNRGSIRQITNTTILGVYDAYFFDGGSSLLLRYKDPTSSLIKTVTATIPNTQENSSPLPLEKMSYLSDDITSVAVSSKGVLAYSVSTDSESVIYEIEKGKQSLVRVIPLRELRLTYGGSNIYATTKPSAFIQGYVFNARSGERVFGGKTGLEFYPSDVPGLAIASMWSSSGLATFIQTQESSFLSLKTLAEKCFWITDQTVLGCAVPTKLPFEDQGLPDDWHQGVATFDDTITVLYRELGTEGVAYNLKSLSGESIDVLHPLYNKQAEMLSFINKRDGSLWVLNLSEYLNQPL